MDKIKFRPPEQKLWGRVNEWLHSNDPKWPIVKFCEGRNCTLIGPRRSKWHGLGWIIEGNGEHNGHFWWGFIEGNMLEQELLARNWKKKRREK